MNIRQALHQDINNLRKLNTLIFEEINQACDDDLVNHFSETPAGLKWITSMVRRVNGCCFIAEDENNLIGYVSAIAMVVPYRKSKYLELDNLGVIPAYYHQGLGRQLLEVVEQWAIKRGFNKIYVNCYAANATARKFYETCKYALIDVCYEKKL